MRILVPILLAVATTVTLVPSATACHPDPVLEQSNPLKGWYLVHDAWYGGCPHELTLCLQLWRESNGEPGLQRTGEETDTPFFSFCPAP